jgi:leucyl/phenylalanyl-tRNA--protein transferase
MKRPSAELVLNAYAQGIFPMSHSEEDWDVYWYAPDPRCVIPLEDFHASRSLERTIRKGVFDIRFDTAFGDVIRACGEPRDDGHGTWISPGIVEVFEELHELGFAHSIETWQDDELVGGLYGLAIGGLFAGESMYHHVTDASKVALWATVQRMKERDMTLFDVQFHTDHLARFGAKEIPRDEYEKLVARAVRLQRTFN